VGVTDVYSAVIPNLDFKPGLQRQLRKAPCFPGGRAAAKQKDMPARWADPASCFRNYRNR